MEADCSEHPLSFFKRVKRDETNSSRCSLNEITDEEFSFIYFNAAALTHNHGPTVESPVQYNDIQSIPFETPGTSFLMCN